MEPTPSSIFSIGILGCAQIAKKNVRAAHKSQSCQVTAIASRSKQKADDFVSEVLGNGDDNQQSIEIYAGDDAYNTLLQNNKLNSVYIPLPTKLHDQYVANALSSNKHVLLEKPVAVSTTSYREMLITASHTNKFLMDGTMFVHHPRTKSFVTSIPNPNRVTFNFTFDPTKNGKLEESNFYKHDIRMKKDGDFMGCVGDLGWYCIRMGLLVFGKDAIDAQVVRCQLTKEGVPFEADCLVHFTENRVLSFHCSFIHPLNQTVSISGTGSEYTATMTDAILPRQGNQLSYTLVKQGLLQDAEITTEETKHMEFDNSNVQEVCMWKNFSRWAKKVDEESSPASEISAGADNEKWWSGKSDEVKEANDIASYSLHTQLILDALMTSIELDGAKVQVKIA